MGWRKCLTIIIFFFLTASFVQAQTVLSAGVFSGFTIPLTIDQGINRDQRYQNRYDIKWAPIGVNLAIDFESYGFLINPSIATIGQNFWVLNSVGGQIGIRKIKMDYLQIPVGVKVHLIDLSFFRVSMTGSVGAGILLNGSETITHEAGKMIFPVEVEPVLPPDYTVEYDGVVVPRVKKVAITTTESYNVLQLFGSLGIRSDWDVSEKSRVSFDLRSNFGFTDTRNNTYLKMINNYMALYDTYGKRKEVYVSFTLGFSRILE